MSFYLSQLECCQNLCLKKFFNFVIFNVFEFCNNLICLLVRVLVMSQFEFLGFITNLLTPQLSKLYLITFPPIIVCHHKIYNLNHNFTSQKQKKRRKQLVHQTLVSSLFFLFHPENLSIFFFSFS